MVFTKKEGEKLNYKKTFFPMSCFENKNIISSQYEHLTNFPAPIFFHVIPEYFGERALKEQVKNSF